MCKQQRNYSYDSDIEFQSDEEYDLNDKDYHDETIP